MLWHKGIIVCGKCGVGIKEIQEYWFMLHDYMWALVSKPKDCMCIGCIESDLGVRLVPSDFNYNVPCSSDFNLPRSERLKNRMGIPENTQYVDYFRQFRRIGESP